jgi:hypothetical protein
MKKTFGHVEAILDLQANSVRLVGRIWSGTYTIDQIPTQVRLYERLIKTSKARDISPHERMLAALKWAWRILQDG